MDSETEYYSESKIKLDIKNVSLKAPQKGKNNNESMLKRIFWMSIPKRECITEIKREYSQVMENMVSNRS